MLETEQKVAEIKSDKDETPDWLKLIIWTINGMPATRSDYWEHSLFEKGQSYLQKSRLISSEEDAGNEVEEILTLEITKPAAKMQCGHITWYQNHTNHFLGLSLVSKFNARLISEADNLTATLNKEKKCKCFQHMQSKIHRSCCLILSSIILRRPLCSSTYVHLRAKYGSQALCFTWWHFSNHPGPARCKYLLTHQLKQGNSKDV